MHSSDEDDWLSKPKSDPPSCSSAREPAVSEYGAVEFIVGFLVTNGGFRTWATATATAEFAFVNPLGTRVPVALGFCRPARIMHISANPRDERAAAMYTVAEIKLAAAGLFVSRVYSIDWRCAGEDWDGGELKCIYETRADASLVRLR